MEKLGRYSLIRKIGSGGMADVWKARAEGAAGFEKLVALKRVLPNLSVDEEFVEMFVREAKLVAGLVHPNIVQVQEFGQEEGSYFIVMEYVAGSSGSALVKQLREKGKRLSADIAVYIAAEASRALGYAHTEGIVHRDVSPHNILLSYRGAVKVADFGIAKVASSGTGTAMGVFKGKLRYASPEQARLLPLDGRSDLFSLGLVLFELLSGEPFFGMGRADEIVQAIVSVDPDKDSRVQAIDEKPLRAVLAKALQPDREKRFASATEMERALLRLLGVEGTIAARTTLSQLLPILFKEEHAADRSDSPSGNTPVPSKPASEPFQPQFTPPHGLMAGGASAPEEVLADATVAKGSPIALAPILRAREQAKARMPVVEGAGTMTVPGGPARAPIAKSAGAERPRRSFLLPGLAVGVLAIGAAGLWASGILPTPGTPTRTPTPFAVSSGSGFEIRRDGAVVLDGTMVKSARAVNDGFGWSVNLSLTPGGATRMADVSGSSIGRPLAMLVDGEVVSEPIVRERIENGELSVSLGPGADEKAARDLAERIAPPSAVAIARTPEPVSSPEVTLAPPPSPTPTPVTIASRPVTPTPRATSTPRPTPTKRPVATPAPVTAVTLPPTPRPTPVAVAATATGLLTVRADPWAEVWVDGKRLASETPMVKKAVPVGKRLVQLKNPVAGFDQSIAVEIAEGQLVILDADVQGGTIRRTK